MTIEPSGAIIPAVARSRPGWCRYCGERCAGATCASCSDLPRLEPAENLSRDAGYEALKSRGKRSKPHKEGNNGS